MGKTMRRLVLSTLLALISMPQMLSADSYTKREMRAVWLTTVWGNDWPSTTGTTSKVATTQKEEMTGYLDQLQADNFNCVFFQVRSMCDAMYKSSYEPWSSYLTGTRGSAPAWDPLAFVVEECHKRGMECHAWINPYRYSTGSNWNTSQDKALSSAGLLLSYTNGTTTTTILNPGKQGSIDRICNVCLEIVNNYDVDGIVFDDYFYPNGIPETNSAGDYSDWQNSGTSLDFGDWRRDNVNRMVKAVYDGIAASSKPWVRFGISPAGIACTSSSVAASHGVERCTYGSDWQYDGIYSDPVEWIEQGTIDYISPQIYWKTTNSKYPFDGLTNWWSKVASQFGRHHFASHSISSLVNDNSKSSWEEVGLQLQSSRDYTLNDAPGEVFFSLAFISGKKVSGLGEWLLANKYQKKAIIPAITWKSATSQGKVSGLTVSSSQLSWTAVSGMRYAVYAIPSSLSHSDAASTAGGVKSDYLLGITYTNSYTIPSGYTSGYYYAVSILDRYSNEYEPCYSNGSGDEGGGDEGGGDTPIEPGYSQITEGHTYSSINGVELKNLWIRSVDNGNISFEQSGSFNRSFCVVDDVIYISARDANSSDANCSLLKYDAATGAKIGTLSLPSSVQSSYYPCNDVMKDSNGNIAVSNLTLNIATTPLSLFEVDKTTGNVTSRASVTSSKLSSGRVDHCSVTGDLATGNFTLFAAVAQTTDVIKWTFVNGSMTNETVVSASDVYPSGATFGIAPRVFAKSATDFYVNGSNIAPLRMGATSDSFASCESLVPGCLATNGFAAFSLAEKNYMVYPENDYSITHSFKISTTGSTTAFSQLDELWEMPYAGLGCVNNNSCDALVDYQLHEEDKNYYCDIFFYVPGNGLAAYRLFDADYSTSIALSDCSIDAKYVNGKIIVSEPVDLIEVFNLSGAKIAQAVNTHIVTFNQPRGVYMAQIVSNGLTYTKKIIIK